MKASGVEREDAELGSQLRRQVNQDNVFRPAEADADAGRKHFKRQSQDLARMPLRIGFS